MINRRAMKKTKTPFLGSWVPTWFKWCPVRDSNPPHRIKSPALYQMS
jgi:hypothetical protein